MRETLSALAGVLALPALASTALAQNPAGAATHHGVLAQFHGRTVDLAEGWHGFHACVLHDDGKAECYDTREHMHDALRAAARAAPSQGGASPAAGNCGGASRVVALFSGTNWSGDELDLEQTGGWANLAGYGFDNRMQSWANSKTCNEVLADGTAGTGATLTLGAGAFSLDAGSWKNKASSAFVVF